MHSQEVQIASLWHSCCPRSAPRPWSHLICATAELQLLNCSQALPSGLTQLGLLDTNHYVGYDMAAIGAKLLHLKVTTWAATPTRSDHRQCAAFNGR